MSRYHGKRKDPYSVYVLKCEDDVTYVGMTGNLKQRLNEHRSGEGSEVTKKFSPVKVVEVVKCKTKTEAKNLEKEMYHEYKTNLGERVRGAGNCNSTNL